MPDLPVMLNVRGKRCVIIGGGSVAARRADALIQAGARVAVIAPQIDQALRELADSVRHDNATVMIRPRAYQSGDLKGARLVVIATHDPNVNDAAAAEARREGALINRADDPAAGDLAMPAHAHHGPITLAVHTGGVSAAAAATIRRELSQALDPGWTRLLETAAPYRRLIQRRWTDPAVRRTRLRRLTDADAMSILKQQGVDALRRRCESLATS